MQANGKPDPTVCEYLAWFEDSFFSLIFLMLAAAVLTCGSWAATDFEQREAQCEMCGNVSTRALIWTLHMQVLPLPASPTCKDAGPRSFRMTPRTRLY